jgi:hypothetical protein
VIVDNKVLLIALDDFWIYRLSIFDNSAKPVGLDLEVATDQVSFAEIAGMFTQVTGKKDLHKRVPLEEPPVKGKPYPRAYTNWEVKPDEPRDASFMI